jgi:hypothetical protein
MFYKIINNLVPSYLTMKIPQTISSLMTYRLRNSTNIRINPRRLYISQSSFIPSTTKLWNLLPNTTRTLPTINNFKSVIQKQSSPKPTSYYRSCSGKHGNWLTRLRLGLSALNAQRFAYNLIDQPICTMCYREQETTVHYLYRCPSYGLARNRLYGRLNDELGIDTGDREKLLDIIIHGTISPDKHTQLLNIIYEFMISTKRFK